MGKQKQEGDLSIGYLSIHTTHDIKAEQYAAYNHLFSWCEESF